MHSRRKFIGQFASGIAGTLATGSVLGANGRIRLGLIGAGDRGMQLVREAVTCPNAEVVAFADIYTKRLEEAKKTVPGAQTFLDHRYLLDLVAGHPFVGFGALAAHVVPAAHGLGVQGRGDGLAAASLVVLSALGLQLGGHRRDLAR